jgi:hypothetical protein
MSIPDTFLQDPEFCRILHVVRNKVERKESDALIYNLERLFDYMEWRERERVLARLDQGRFVTAAAGAGLVLAGLLKSLAVGGTLLFVSCLTWIVNGIVAQWRVLNLQGSYHARKERFVSVRLAELGYGKVEGGSNAS